MRTTLLAFIGSLFAVLVVALVRWQAPMDQSHLYRAQTIVTGSDETNRGPAVRRCLEEVLIKVSGDPSLARDPGLAAVLDRAAELVVALDYHDRMDGIPIGDEQGTRDRPFDLTVAFSREGIHVALRSLQRQPWLAPRPTVMAMISVVNGARRFRMAADSNDAVDYREALGDAAKQFGLPVILPTIAQWAALDGNVPVSDDGSNAASLTGRMLWQGMQWHADWALSDRDRTWRWSADVASFDEAFRTAMRGSLLALSATGAP